MGFLEAAIEEARQGLGSGGIPIGAVLVLDGKIIGRGHNRRVQRGSTVLHAEMDCLENAGRLSASEYRRTVLYTTLSPCDMCSGSVLLYGIPRVVIGENSNFRGPEDYLASRGVELEVLQNAECVTLLQDFIRQHPDLWHEDIGEPGAGPELHTHGRDKVSYERPAFVDLSHTIEDGLITYKGLPAPVICDYLSREQSRQVYADGTEFQIGRIDMVANTGTYIDCPFHRYEHGKDLSEVGIDAFTNLEALVIRADYHKALAVDARFFEAQGIRNRAVLVHTGWDKHWNTDAYFQDHPYLTEDAAQYLKRGGALLVGIDSHNIDDTSGNKRPVHSCLLGAGILIVEHLCNLDRVPDDGFRFSAAPPKIRRVGTFPVRATASFD
jgi:arylformamidase